MLYYGIIDKAAYFELESVLEARRELFTMCNYIEKLGYDIQKINKGSYWTVAILFLNEFQGESKLRYKTWQLAESISIENAY